MLKGWVYIYFQDLIGYYVLYYLGSILMNAMELSCSYRAHYFNNNTKNVLRTYGAMLPAA